MNWLTITQEHIDKANALKKEQRHAFDAYVSCPIALAIGGSAGGIFLRCDETKKSYGITLEIRAFQIAFDNDLSVGPTEFELFETKL